MQEFLTIKKALSSICNHFNNDRVPLNPQNEVFDMILPVLQISIPKLLTSKGQTQTVRPHTAILMRHLTQLQGR